MQTTQPITRRAISQQDFLKDHVKGNFETEFFDKIQHLNDLVRHSLGTIVPNSHDALEHMECHINDLPFRLVSWTLPARPISLLPAYHASVSHQRPAEDTPQEASVRHLQAEEVAVDLDWISRAAHFNAASQVSPHLRNGAEYKSTKYFMTTKLSAPFTSKPSMPPPNLLVTEPVEPQATSLKAGRDDRWKAKIKCYTVLSLSVDSDSRPKKKRKRKSHPKERQPPGFFRPMQEWGGKSAGYAMGWRASWPTYRQRSTRYFRDTMRRGLFAQIE